MRLILYGGSFNPPHLGHAAALKALADALTPDKIIVMPAWAAPHKPLPDNTPSAAHRLEMCRLMAKAVPPAEVSDFEMLSGASVFTVDTARHLAARYPGAELWLAVGQDMLFTLDTWRGAEALLRLCKVAAFAREDGAGTALEHCADTLKTRFGADIRIIGHRPVEVSSTALRDLLPRGEGQAFLPAEVRDYIQKNGLYAKRS